MSARHTVKLTANFERNLEEIEVFLRDIEAPQAFDALLEELSAIVIPNLEHFPGMGRSLLGRVAGSVETSNAIARLLGQMNAITDDGDIHEYVMANYLLLYARSRRTVYLLSIRHHRQLSFDLASHWPS